MNLEITPQRANHPNWAAAQKEAFLLSQKGQHPPFNIDPEELERLAKEYIYPLGPVIRSQLSPKRGE